MPVIETKSVTSQMETLFWYFQQDKGQHNLVWYFQQDKGQHNLAWYFQQDKGQHNLAFPCQIRFNVFSLEETVRIFSPL